MLRQDRGQPVGKEPGRSGAGPVRHLILVRHAMPEIIPDVPAREWHLSAVGRRSCERLSKRLSPFQPDAAIASTEPKAIETARQVAERLGLPCHILEGLHEHDRRGEPYGDRASFQAAVFRFFAAPEKLVFGRETADQAYQRFSQALQQVQERYPVRNPAIFTHGTVMCLYVGRAASQDPYRLWQRLGLPAFIVLSLPENEIVAIVEEV